MSSLRTTIHESLPYVDADPTPAQRAAAEALIEAELSSSEQPDGVERADHPDLPAAFTPHFTPALEAELSRIANSADPKKPSPLRAIDLARYEAQEEDDDEAAQPASDPARLRDALARAHATHTYLRARREHLALLDAAEGRNAWLVGNWQLETELKALEAELARTKREVDVLALQRRRAQEEVGGELRGLDDAWRKGVGQVLEVEIATQALRTQLAEQRATTTAAAV